ncbi:hypothetical protein L2E82_12851 [Cichorium intybus]|uniref:Uncharacterized protein n=1 Tax=Cichorium intybus TaxID=13427 RepID=A0ACB9GIF6_CICIN|nr:hypothetical protein L2E82_12851 [Cichorium intybus]
MHTLPSPPSSPNIEYSAPISHYYLQFCDPKPRNLMSKASSLLSRLADHQFLILRRLSGNALKLLASPDDDFFRLLLDIGELLAIFLALMYIWHECLQVMIRDLVVKQYMRMDINGISLDISRSMHGMK